VNAATSATAASRAWDVLLLGGLAHGISDESIRAKLLSSPVSTAASARAVAMAFASEGTDVLIVYLSENDDAHDTGRLVENAGAKPSSS
jgi:hypothetical protein